MSEIAEILEAYCPKIRASTEKNPLLALKTPE
jgi:hypothetical protein